ncbi:MAG: ATP-dependent DNA helicase [Micavibrio aeruginosavorus]|nr:ATP-dependent DNA helicase [Micavibrio aeruginosavorus]
MSDINTYEKPLQNGALPAVPAIPALAVNAGGAAMMMPDGEIKILSHEQARMITHKQPVMVCHAPFTRARLGADDFFAFDVLELFAFVHPGKFCVPTPHGLAKFLGLSLPAQFDDTPIAILESAQTLLADLRAAWPATSSAAPNQSGEKRISPLEISAVMGLNGRGWAWTPFIFSALGQNYDPEKEVMAKNALHVWRHLPAWSEEAPPPPPSHYPVTGEEARERLKNLLLSNAHETEPRPQQVDYATRLTAAFAPLENAESPHVVLAEAGTGVGKTLGYIAPASVWAEKNGGTVWVSTYTRNLQRQWAEVTREGDLSGGDFPGWLPGLLGNANTSALSDRRGECIYSACDHYHKCFVERAIRKSHRASIVVANHALVMIQTALAGPDGDLPQRYVFDEGHHLFEAADSAFAAHLTAWETADLRRWILGPEGGRRTRARGLKRRVEDLIENDAPSIEALDDILQTAHILPAHGWSRRLRDKNPFGATEIFLSLVYQQVYARADGRDGPYSLETATRPLIDGLGDAARTLKARLRDLQKPMLVLATRLRTRLDDHADTLDSDTRKRLEAVSSALLRRAENEVGSWIAMLNTLEDNAESGDFVDWMAVERSDGQASDVGLYRHHVDPMNAFAASIRRQAQGIAITSATLRDGTGDEEQDWRAAMERTGGLYLSESPQRLSVPSPYDYAAATRCFVITDVKKEDIRQVAAAYRVLFEAAGGGGLGLFTAIQRLRAVYENIHLPLEGSGIALYAQHVDAMDTGTLVDIFREERNACLLGTDAVRDGVDVPGDALRLLVYDRVPWPRPNILHKARRDAFGGRRYDEMSTRLKLRQAFGRLIRRADDRGVFVMLDSGLPSRLHGAFPDGVVVERIGLADAAKRIREFLGAGQ